MLAPAHHRTPCVSWIASFVGLLFIQPHLGAQTQPAESPVDLVFTKLVAESENLLPPKPEGQPQPHFGRPHPMVRNLKSSDAPEVARRLAGRLTGDVYRDAYIRYHGMAAVLEASPADVKACAEDLIKLLKVAPDVDKQRPESKKPATWDNPELANKRHALYWQAVATVGYPPFQRHIGPPESFKHMTPEQKQKAERALEELKKLPEAKLVGGDPGAYEWNIRINYVYYQMWDCRFSVLYSLVRTGHDKALDTVSAEVSQRARGEVNYAYDAILALNAGLRDGSLSRYDPAKIKNLTEMLRRTTQGNPVAFNRGTRLTTLPYATMYLVHALTTGRVPSAADLQMPKPPPAATTKPAPVTADQITLARINEAIERGTAALLPPPPITPLAQVDRYSHDMMRYSLPITPGLVAWALLATGLSHQDPAIQRHLTYVLSYDTHLTFDVAMRLTVLAHLPQKGYEQFLRRDTDILFASLTPEGKFMHGVKSPYGATNSEAVYGAMGMWVVQRRGMPVKPEMWQAIEKHWRVGQMAPINGAAGWGLYPAPEVPKTVDPNVMPYVVTGPMTAAGVLALSRAEHALHSMPRPPVRGSARSGTKAEDAQWPSREVQRGLNWLDRNFSFDDTRGDEDNAYYMWTIQNLGQATGYRSFNKLDWFREGTARLLSSQDADGFWRGPKGPQVSTAFALLYLSRARGPLPICKLRFNGDWNNRPYDLFNLTEYLSGEFEIPNSWQIADLDQPVHELIESPLLYLASEKGPEFSQQEMKRLREYIDAGGMLVCVPEGRTITTPIKAYKAMLNELFPGMEPKRIERDHPFYSLHQKLRMPVPLQIIDNGVRPLAVVVEKDIGKELQTDQPTRHEAFGLLANMYLYATGREAKRPRIKTNYVVRSATTQPSRTIHAARIKLDGESDPEPGSMSQLHALLAQRHGVELRLNTVPPTQLSQETVAFVTTTPATRIDDKDAAALLQWLERGGTLWLDAGGGSSEAKLQLDQFLGKLKLRGNPLKALPRDGAVITGQGIENGYDNRKPVWRQFEKERADREAVRFTSVGSGHVYVSRGDLAAGLAGLEHWGIAGLTPQFARQIVVNGLLNTFAAPPTTAPTTAPTTRTTQPQTNSP